MDFALKIVDQLSGKGVSDKVSKALLHESTLHASAEASVSI